jgi:hypothetical protein
VTRRERLTGPLRTSGLPGRDDAVLGADLGSGYHETVVTTRIHHQYGSRVVAGLSVRLPRGHRIVSTAPVYPPGHVPGSRTDKSRASREHPRSRRPPPRADQGLVHSQRRSNRVDKSLIDATGAVAQTPSAGFEDRALYGSRTDNSGTRPGPLRAGNPGAGNPGAGNPRAGKPRVGLRRWGDCDVGVGVRVTNGGG